MAVIQPTITSNSCGADEDTSSCEGSYIPYITGISATYSMATFTRNDLARIEPYDSFHYGSSGVYSEIFQDVTMPGGEKGMRINLAGLDAAINWTLGTYGDAVGREYAPTYSESPLPEPLPPEWS